MSATESKWTPTVGETYPVLITPIDGSYRVDIFRTESDRSEWLDRLEEERQRHLQKSNGGVPVFDLDFSGGPFPLRATVLHNNHVRVRLFNDDGQLENVVLALDPID